MEPLSESRAFEPIASVRMSSAIADQIRHRIRSGELHVGDRLPPERELYSQFGVSRLTVREALRMLEATGLVTMKLGKDGGAFVSAPSVSFVGEGITDLLTTAGLASAQITEVRTLVELALLPLACERATPEDISDLRELCARDEEARAVGQHTPEMSFEFHLGLAKCVHNPAATMLLNGFREPILMSIHDAHHAGTSGLAEHRRLVDAIEEHNLPEATRELAAHLERTAAANRRRS